MLDPTVFAIGGSHETFAEPVLVGDGELTQAFEWRFDPTHQ
jgi:hypothetical protein